VPEWRTKGFSGAQQEEMVAESVERGTMPEGKRAATPAPPKRPRELQDPLNFYLYHPLAWRLALILAKTPVTPNMVSIFGGLLVVAAAIAYTGLSWPVSALLGLVLHMSWHVVDGADGDLARITGRASPTGELVDGICDYASHIVLYLIMAGFLDKSMGWIAWPIAVFAGISHAAQSNHVEVQRRQYQWWVYGTPWLRQTHASVEGAARSGFFGFLESYLSFANGLTPFALGVDAAVDAAQGDPARLDVIRTAVRAEAPPLLLMCKFLGPNPRALVLGASMLIGSPLYYFIYQGVVLNVLMVISVRMHNAAAKRIALRIG
jgi:phosphatidylglycerophosphate synthase